MGAEALMQIPMTSTHVLSPNECYSVRLMDSYGDGQQYGAGTDPNGGFEFNYRC